MIALIFIILLFFLFPFFFPGSYVAELMMSFLPYLLGLSVVFVVISFVNLRKNMKPGNSKPALRYFRGIAFLAFCGLFFVWSKQFNGFYTTPLPEQMTNSGGVHVLFANLQKDNTKYTELEEFISQKDPDVLMFVEFSDHHYEHFKEFLKTQYPYTNNISRSTTFVGSMVFSKYPINNRADDFPQGAWRYGYFSLNYQGKDIYFYLVHTSSPDSYSHFVMRNEQLQTFVDDFQTHEVKNKHKNVLVAGDFNITPWSSYYSILSDVFSDDMINITTHIPFLFTRKLFALPFLQAHIDHLWATSTLRISTIQKVNIPGSDHKGFLFDIGYNDR